MNLAEGDSLVAIARNAEADAGDAADRLTGDADARARTPEYLVRGEPNS